MSRAVQVVAPDAPLAHVVRTMHGERLSCLVVCTERRPVGVISERDLVGVLLRLATGDRPCQRAQDIMSSPPITVCERAATDGAMQRIREHGIRRLVVVDDAGRLTGLLTQTDLLRAHTIEIENQRDRLERTVAERTRELVEANQRLEMLSLLDGLLGIGNRRAMEMSLDKLQAVASRYGRPYAVALLDVDHFKAYNDTYGHVEADRRLRTICETLAAMLRSVDSLYRYGGEELLLLLPETSLEGGLRVAERARQAVEGLGIDHRGAPGGVLTVSGGVAVCGPEPEPDADWRAVVARADRALYAVKSAGRNRVGAVAPATAQSS